MKRNFKLFVILPLVLVIVVLLVFPIGKRFTLPFAAEDVSSVILWSFWGYKEVTDVENVSIIVEEMNDVRLCGEFDFENYAPREGDYGCSAFFLLKDGRTYEYATMPKLGLATIFRDADGTYYKAKNIPIEKIYNELDLALQSGKPFLTE